MQDVVAVIRGGTGSGYDMSLLSGASVLTALDRNRYHVRDLFVDRGGEWYWDGAPTTAARAMQGVDMAINTQHGTTSEDGQLARFFQNQGVAYIGSEPIASAFAFDKVHTKQLLKKVGIQTPRALLLSRENHPDLVAFAFDLFRQFPQPSIVKPTHGSLSEDVFYVDSYDALIQALTEGFSRYEKLLVEEFISGREATVGVIEGFRNEPLYTLPETEIVPPIGKAFFDRETKHADLAYLRTPGLFSESEKREIADIARTVHQALGLSHWSRTDVIVHPRRGIFVLEVNPYPDLAPHSTLTHALSAVGAPLGTALDHLIQWRVKRG